MGDSKKKEKSGDSPSKSPKGSPKPLPEHLLRASAIDYALDHAVASWMDGNIKKAEEWMYLAHSYHHMSEDQFKKYRESRK